MKLPDNDGLAKCRYGNKTYSYKKVEAILLNRSGTSFRGGSCKERVEDPLSPQMIKLEKNDEELIDSPTSSLMYKVRWTDLDATLGSIRLIKLKKPTQQLSTSNTPLSLPNTKKVMLDKKFLEMIMKDQETFSIIEGEGFRKFVHALNPYYELVANT